MTSSFAGRGQARACWWRKRWMNMRQGRGVWGWGTGVSLHWKVKVRVCMCRWIFPCRTHLTGNQRTERERERDKSEGRWLALWGLTEEMCCSHTHMSLSQGVRRSQPDLLFFPPPSSSSSSSVWRKKNLLSIEIARPISAYFCFERKGKHWLKNWVTKERWVWRAKSQFYWCSPAFFFFLFIYF